MLQKKLKKLPSAPGVYFMKDGRGNVIYVGKSKNLKSRVSSYFQHSKNHSNKVERLVNHVKDIDYIVTDTEFEALLKEAKFIRELQPLYNRLMKNPKSYPYIIFERKKGYYHMTVSLSPSKEEGSLFFGPYSSKSQVEKAVNGLKNAFKINCENWDKPCLDYSLGKCLGMCLGGDKIDQYEQVINRFICLFSREDKSILEELERDMNLASANFQFEKAAKIRDTLKAVKSLLRKEEMIEFARKQISIGLFDSVDEETVKFFLIKRNVILFSKKYNWKKMGLKRIIEELTMEILEQSCFPFQMSGILQQDEIDDAAIIYSFVQKKGSSSFLIPDDWLSRKEGIKKIEQSIKKLMEKIKDHRMG